MPEVKSDFASQIATETASGAWPSPIAAEQVARGALRLSQTVYDSDGEALYWLEGRPSQGGRSILVKRAKSSGGDHSSSNSDINQGEDSIRSLVHEYGGGAFGVDGGEVAYSNFADQRVYLAAGTKHQAISAAHPGNTHRYADYCFDRSHNRLLCVLEVHTAGASEPTNCIASVALPAGGSYSIDQAGEEPVVLASGFDFYSSPRISPDGRHLAYLCWRHPNMPWDGCELYLADVDKAGSLHNTRLVAGGPDCSVFQPQWSPQGKLFFVADQSGYWQPQVICDPTTSEVQPLVTNPAYAECEFGQPMWGFAQSTYAVLSETLAIFAFNRRGIWSLARLELDFTNGHKLVEIDSPFTEFSYLTAGKNRVAMLAASASLPQCVVEYDLQSGAFNIIKSAAGELPDKAYMSMPQVIEFPTAGGKTAFAFYYPPTNPNCKSLAGEAPPLVVKCHGGPTGGASSSLSLGIQYWTSRGFAIVDVNYGGSTGFGREYRKRLNDNWGVVDVEDCRNCVEYLVESGLADAERVAITGGSAGGYTVLCALTFTDTFKAGASHYGIGDLEALARDTHKFEARYLDNLVAPYPAGRDLYIARSPINHVDKLNCPVIFFQGLDDKVVPPNQAEAMVNALKAKGIPVAYIAYEGEAHGFRKAENIIRTIESEYYFFTRIFGIKADHSFEVQIDNLIT